MRIQPEWEILNDGETLSKNLCDVYPEKLGHIDPTKVGVAVITNKDRGDTQEWDSKMVGITPPASLFSTKQYVIYTNKNTWDSYTPAQRSVMIMRHLLRIPDPADGSIAKEDLKDLKCLVRAWGVDYMESPQLPDISVMKQTF